MNINTERSLDDLRRGSERERLALATTVAALRDRVGETASEIKTLVSPSHIKQEIGNYVRQEKESIFYGLQRAAKDNPLQLAAFAAAVAYPALGLLRTLPKPLWLIGAGLFLTSRKGRRIGDDLKSQIGGAVQHGADKITDIAEAVQDNVQGQLDTSQQTLADAQNTAAAKVSEFADHAKTVVSDATTSFVDSAKDAAAGVSNYANDMTATTSRSANQIGNQLQATARNSSNAIADFVKDNSLLVAGIGAVVGAIIAASIPPSDAENRLFGSGSEKLKEKARESAAKGIEAIGELAADTAGAVAVAATSEGLHSAGVQNALNEVAEKVRTVADRGLNTALGKQQKSVATESFDSSSFERKAP